MEYKEVEYTSCITVSRIKLLNGARCDAQSIDHR